MTDQQLSLPERLERFNAKERYWLLRHLYREPGGPGFSPRRERVEELARAAGLEPPPEGGRIFAAMDYHLSWLHAALWGAAAGPDSSKWHANHDFPAASGETRRYVVEENQEDIDFLIAYDVVDTAGGAPITQLLMIEAKGVTQFGDKQLLSKLPRLAEIIRLATDPRREGEVCGPKRRFGIAPSLLLMSPNRPDGLIEKIRTDPAFKGFSLLFPPRSKVWCGLQVGPEKTRFWQVKLRAGRRAKGSAAGNPSDWRIIERRSRNTESNGGAGNPAS